MFLIAFYFTLATGSTEMAMVFRKVSLNIPAKSPSVSTTIIFWIPNKTRSFQTPIVLPVIMWSTLVVFLVLSKTLLYIPSVSQYFRINTGLGYILVLIITIIPHQMDYLNKWCEVEYVPHEFKIWPISDMRRLLWIYLTTC